MIAYFDGRFFVQRMQHTAVLNVYSIANAYGIDISAKHRAVPNAAVVSYLYITDNGGILC